MPAYFAEIRNWIGIETVLTVGFIGYVLIITAVSFPFVLDLQKQ